MWKFLIFFPATVQIFHEIIFFFFFPFFVPFVRYEVKHFEVEMDSELHGFGGYFECTLYKNVTISINPMTHSPGMFSWFPIFFPLKNPVKLKVSFFQKSHSVISTTFEFSRQKSRHQIT